MELAFRRMYRGLWSTDILRELRENLIAKFKVSPEKADGLLAAMAMAVKDAEVKNYDGLCSTIQLPDPDDRHVLEAAIQGKAQVIVTENIRHFPKDVLAKFGIEVQKPDDFLVSLYDLYASEVLDAVRFCQESKKDPQRTWAEQLQYFRKSGLTKFAQRLESRAKVEEITQTMGVIVETEQ
jgi:predicted nucleic acid-binding protein